MNNLVGMSLNQENGLPPEVRKFMDKYLPGEAAKQAFLRQYAALKNEQDRRRFLDRYADEPTNEEAEAILQTIANRKKADLN